MLALFSLLVGGRMSDDDDSLTADATDDAIKDAIGYVVPTFVWY
jgi:hypothetical protein